MPYDPIRPAGGLSTERLRDVTLAARQVLLQHQHLVDMANESCQALTDMANRVAHEGWRQVALELGEEEWDGLIGRMAGTLAILGSAARTRWLIDACETELAGREERGSRTD